MLSVDFRCYKPKNGETLAVQNYNRIIDYLKSIETNITRETYNIKQKRMTSLEIQIMK